MGTLTTKKNATVTQKNSGEWKLRGEGRKTKRGVCV